MTTATNESRPYTWNELADDEKAEARVRGFKCGPSIRYVVNVTAKNGEYLLSRWEKA